MPPVANRPHHEPEPPVHPDHDRGLEFDVAHPRWRAGRRWDCLGGAGLAALVGCTDGASSAGAGSSAATSGSTGASASPSVTASGTASGTASAVDTQVPAETAGPFPGDGSNGAGRARRHRASSARDLRSSIGTSTTTADRRAAHREPHRARLGRAATAPWRRRRLRVARRRPGPLLDVLAGRGGRELPARRAADRLVGHGELHHGLPRLLRRAAGRTSTSRSTAAPREATSDGQIVRTSQIALPAAACEAVYADTRHLPGQRGQPLAARR